MGPQLPMTLHPSTSNLPWSRLRTTVPPPSLLPGQLSTILPAMRYRLDREELQAMPSTTITGYHRQMGLLMGESAKQPVSLTITVLVSMGEEETDGPDARRLDQQLYISPSTADMWSLQAGS